MTAWRPAHRGSPHDSLRRDLWLATVSRWKNRPMADALIAAAPRAAALAVAAAGLALAVGAIVAVDPATEPATTYAAAFPAARVADAVAGLGMVLAGAFACLQATARRLGLLLLLACLAWFGADWDGALDAPALLRSVGALAAPFSLVLVLHLVLSLPGGHIRSPAARASVVSVARALVRDPLLDLYCWRNCGDNAFLIHAYPGAARALGDLWLWAALAIGLGLIAFAAHRLLTASGPARRVAAPLLVPAVLVGAAETAYAAAVLRTPLEDPERAGFAAIFLARSFAFTALAAGLAWNVLRVPRTRARVARLASELGEAPPPGKLREALVAALAIPTSTSSTSVATRHSS
jgi:hypothetical protein